MDVALFHDEPGRTILPALRDGRLLGQFTAENIGELLMFRSARSHLASSPPAHSACLNRIPDKPWPFFEKPL